MRLGAYSAMLEPRVAGGRGLRHRGGHRAPPAPLRVQRPVPGRAGGGRAAVLGHLARRPAGRVRRAARAPLLGRAPRPTPSSRAGPTAPTRCSATWCGRRSSAPRAASPALIDLSDLDAVSLSRPTPAAQAAGGGFERVDERRVYEPRLLGGRSPLHRPRRRGFGRERRPTSRGGGGGGRRRRRRRATLIRQFRAALDRWILEIPAGTCDVEGEDRRGHGAARARAKRPAWPRRRATCSARVQLAGLLRPA